MKVHILLILMLLVSCASSDDYIVVPDREASGSSFKSGARSHTPAGHKLYCEDNPEHISCPKPEKKPDSELAKPSM